ncbi:MAG: rRNA maturation RNase YbeY [Chloroflexi bacterium]|nr:rRNA maturation RNase YbeY [Chloroflexota bacterium]
MPRHVIDIEIDRSTGCRLRAVWFQRIVSQALASAGVREAAEVAVLVTSDERVQELNQRYRGVDTTTDVLSFALNETKERFPREPSAPKSLGQVVVSYPRAVSQAAEYGHSVEREVAFLTVHGILHLLGYDHQRPRDETRMVTQQEVILTALGITRE